MIGKFSPVWVLMAARRFVSRLGKSFVIQGKGNKVLDVNVLKVTSVNFS